MTLPDDEPVIHVDEDWKSRVKAEDAAMEKKLKEETVTPDSNQVHTHDHNVDDRHAHDHDHPGEVIQDPPQLPPASIHALIQMLVSESMVCLGVVPHPVDGKPHFLPNLAKHFIDLLSVLEDKTKGNLAPEEAQGIETVLHQLRMAYVQQKNSQPKS
jgi:hypothetical protein